MEAGYGGGRMISLCSAEYPEDIQIIDNFNEKDACRHDERYAREGRKYS